MLFRTVLIVSILIVVTVAGILVSESRFDIRLDAVEPSTAFVGQDITLTGKGFEPAETLVVLFDGVRAAPMQATPGAIRVKVPDSARSGVVAVQSGTRRSNTRYIEIIRDASRSGAMVGMGMEGMPPGHPTVGGAEKARGVRTSSAPGKVENAADQEAMMGGQMTAHVFYPKKERVPAKDFSLSDLQGNPRNLSDYKGKMLVLNFWATWCPPCMEEIPSLERLTTSAEKQQEDLAVLAVSVDKSAADIEKALPNLKLNVALDPEGKVAESYGTKKFPETYIIDRQGEIVAKFIGARNWDSPVFQNYLKMMIQGKDPMSGE